MNFKKLLAQGLVWRSLYFVSMLLVNVFLSRFLKATGTGQLYFLLNIYSFIQIVASLSLEAGITYFSAGSLVSPNKLLWFSCTWVIAMALLVLGCTFFYQQGILHAPLPTALRYSFFAVSYIAGLSLTNYCSVLFYMQSNFIVSNAILIFFNIAFLVAMPFIATTNHNASAGVVLDLYFSVFILQGFFLAVAFAIINKSWRQISFPSFKQIGQVLQYSLVAHSGNIIFFLGYRIDYWFVHINTAVCTDADLGNYIQVSKMGQLFLIVPQIIASVIFPRSASGGNRQELSTALMTISRLLSQFFLVTFVIILLFGGVLFTTVFGPTFNQMQWPFLIILPGIFCLSVLVLLAAYFSGKGVLRVNVVGNALALVVIAAGDYFLVPVYGIIGAAVVSTLGYFVNTLYALMRFYKDYSITWSDFFKWRRQDYTWLRNLLTGGA